MTKKTSEASTTTADTAESKENTENTTERTPTAATQPASSLTKAERDAIAAMPYEEARDRLIQAVRELENGGLTLEQSMRQWELGEALATRAQSLLADVRARLDAAAHQQASTATTAGTQSNLE